MTDLNQVVIQTLAPMALAFVLGFLIGLERQWRQRTAGLRTNVLVAVGAAAFASLGLRVRGAEGATQIVAYIVSGIGFLGAGVIVKDGTNIRGLNTAATLWGSAAVGAFAGCGLLIESVVLAGFVLAGNTLLRPAVNWVNRRPLDEKVIEAHYHVHVFTAADATGDVRDLLFETLEKAGYPVRSVDTIAHARERAELIAEIVPTSADAAELDAVVDALETNATVLGASWSVRTPG